MFAAHLSPDKRARLLWSDVRHDGVPALNFISQSSLRPGPQPLYSAFIDSDTNDGVGPEQTSPSSPGRHRHRVSPEIASRSKSQHFVTGSKPAPPEVGPGSRLGLKEKKRSCNLPACLCSRTLRLASYLSDESQWGLSGKIYVTERRPVMILSLWDSGMSSTSGTTHPPFSYRLCSRFLTRKRTGINSVISRTCAFVHPRLMISGSRSPLVRTVCGSRLTVLLLFSNRSYQINIGEGEMNTTRIWS